MQRLNESEESFSSIPGVDPYIDWAFGAGRDFYVFTDKDQEWLPVLLELAGTTTQAFARSFQERFANAGDAIIQFSDLYTDPPAGLEESSFGSALVTRKFLEILRSDDFLQKQVTAVTLGPPLAPEGPRRSPSHES